MLIYKILSGLAAIALGAAAVLSFPGFSPEVEARTPPPVMKGDRLDIQNPILDCSEQAWPYYEARCLVRPGSQPRVVRLISIDRIER
jgi:hypothetical protein